MRQEYQQFVRRDIEVIVVGPEKLAEFAAYWQKESFPFIGLPDPEQHVLTLYGQEVKLLKLGRMPAQVIIDQQGTIRFAHYGDSMKDIPPNQELLALLDGFNRNAKS